MVAVKEAVNSRANPVTEDLGTRRIGQGFHKGSLEKVPYHPRLPEYEESLYQSMRKMPRPASASHTKNVEKTQSKHHISVKPGTRRHAFADVTNLQGSFLRKEKRDGSKLMEHQKKHSDGVSCSHKCTADLKATLNEKRSKVQPVNIGRRAAVTRFTDTRKSLPVLKRFDKVVSGAAKANNGSSERAKGKDNVSVKSKVGQNVVPQVSQERNHLLRQRASDSFTTMHKIHPWEIT